MAVSNAQLLSVYKELERRIAEIDIRQGGPQGPRGPVGPKGRKGEKGPQGPKGNDGSAGKNGKDGAVGPKGPQGPKGDRGPVGPRGSDGVAGVAGRDGVDGADGRDGLDGTSVVDVQLDFDGRLTVQLSDGSEIDAGEIPLGREGDTIVYSGGGGGGSSEGGGGFDGEHNDLPGLQGNGPEYYHLNEAEWTQVVDWVNNGLPMFTGAGTSGIVPDPTVEQNFFLKDDGTWGEATGPQGPPGTAATVDAGTTTTGAPGTDALVVNSGNTTNAIFDFTIPRGDVGATGAQGPQGDKGDTGDTGPQGDTGATGPIGPEGPAGPQGDIGPAGPAGADGATGPQGPAGPTAISADAGNELTLGTDSLTYFSGPQFAGPTTTGYVPDPTAENGFFLRDDGTWQSPPVSPVGGLEMDYKWNSGTLPTDPVAGDIAVNNADPTLATELYVHTLTRNGTDVGLIWSLVDPNEYIGVWEQAGDNESAYYIITGPGVLNGSVYTFPCSYVFGVGVPEDGRNVQVFVIEAVGNKLPPGGADNTVLKKASAGDYDTEWAFVQGSEIEGTIDGGTY